MTEHPTIRAAVRWLVPLVLLAAVPFMFHGGPTPTSSPVHMSVWNLGHIGFYGLLTVFLYQHLGWLRRPPGWRRLLVLNLAVFIVGVLVEWAQSGTGRQADWHDVWRNHVGVLGAWLIVARPLTRRRLLLAGWSALVLWELALIARTAQHEWAIARRLPVISPLESTSEIAEWSGDVTLVDSLAVVGDHCLRVALDTSTYSGTGTYRLPRDWSDYDSLVFWLCNPDTDSLPLTLRIDDRRHDQRYEDRFNRRVFADPGWHKISIPLDAVRRAPQDRELDLNDVFQVYLFATRLPAPRVIYLDEFRLQ